MKFGKVYVYCDSKTKQGVAKRLAHLLGGQRITNTSLVDTDPTTTPVVVNFGRSGIPDCYDEIMKAGGLFINQPTAVAYAVDKHATLAKLKTSSIPHPRYTTSANDMLVMRQGRKVYIRTTATGKGGDGIIVTTNDKVIKKYDGCLMTIGIDTSYEWRAHVIGGKCIELIQKKRMGKVKLASKGLEKANDDIRSYKNGWVFAKSNLAYTPSQRHKIGILGVAAVNALGLDYGAVDIVTTGANGAPYMAAPKVLEVNTAPGLSSPITTNLYVNGLNEIIHNHIQTHAIDYHSIPGYEVLDLSV